MAAKKRKNNSWTLRELMIRIAVLSVTVGIGLWCGWTDSYSAFYIAALIQAINNLYDAGSHLSGYTKFVTVFEVFVFIGGLFSAILAIVHFTPRGNVVDCNILVILITIALSIPILHYGIHVYEMIKNDRY